ncbi:MAG: hypothetical protein ACJ746_16180 [Bryobacteraceae bacterium]
MKKLHGDRGRRRLLTASLAGCLEWQVPATRLLHIEDDDAAPFLFRLALDEIGFTGTVYRVTNGEDALLFLGKSGAYQNARTPRLVVLDLNLPKRDGSFLLKRGDPFLKQLPVGRDRGLRIAPARRRIGPVASASAQAYSV